MFFAIELMKLANSQRFLDILLLASGLSYQYTSSITNLFLVLGFFLSGIQFIKVRTIIKERVMY
ncbi:hypothetical protein PagCFBP13532_10745 [Pantoea agglomerans]|nr:hypothetical protein PagCFBP13505_20955 [Pantoea agglomerans]TKK15158.1 hypothetical protein PagCFBP13516_21165 [Pantoea agglomerans]TKK35640.1 hypothetical protein PagCFBP13532_10745 [Pantoea agglomerans]